MNLAKRKHITDLYNQIAECFKVKLTISRLQLLASEMSFKHPFM